MSTDTAPATKPKRKTLTFDQLAQFSREFIPVRPEIQQRLDTDHPPVIDEVAKQFGLNYTSARNYLTKAGYKVPSIRSAEWKEAQRAKPVDIHARLQGIEKGIAIILQMLNNLTPPPPPTPITPELPLGEQN